MKNIRQVVEYYLQDFNIFYLNLPILSYLFFYSILYFIIKVLNETS